MNERFDIHTYLPDRQEVQAVLSGDVEDLPSLPVVVLKLLKISSSLESSTDELVKLVETDPAITARVLKVVNSAAYGLSRKILSVKHAVVLMGFDTIRNLALEISIYEQLLQSEQNPGFDRQFFWQHCLSVASLSRAIGEKRGHPDPEGLYFVGLLHDIGKIILDSYGKITYEDFLRHSSYLFESLVAGERRFVGLPHDHLGAYFCNLWGLPDSIILPVRFHHDSYHHLDLDKEKVLEIAIVAMADFLAWAHGIGSINRIRYQTLQPETMEIISLGELDLSELLKRMDHEVQETGRFYDIAFPSLDQLRENLLLFNMDLCRANNAYIHRQDELEGKVKALSNLKESLTSPHGSLHREEIVDRTLAALHREFKYDRLYLLEVEERTRIFKVSFFLDYTGSKDADLVGSAVEITPELGNFIEALRSKIPRVISGSSSDEIKVLKKFGVSELGLVPVVSNERVTGLLCVDNSATMNRISENDLAAVSVVAHEMGKALENARLFRKYRVMASIDGLTGLYNRSVIDEIIGEYFLAAGSDDHPLTLVMVDIDFFKSFNDHFGHIAGDTVLKILAKTMRKFSRPNDYLGRFGGEEFLVILTETGFQDGFRYAERLRKEVERLGRLLQKRFPGHNLTVSMGVASYDKDMAEREDLVAKADEHLYLAKEMGRNKVVGVYKGEKKWAGGESPVNAEGISR